VVAFVDEALSRAPVVCDLSSPLQILQCDTHSAVSFSTCCLIDFNLAFSTSERTFFKWGTLLLCIMLSTFSRTHGAWTLPFCTA
jgi:hypothetical protein